MARDVLYDPLNDEAFARVVGHRARPIVGEPPSRESREAMAAMSRYRTAAPKGVFRYKTHEDANRDRERWTIQRAVACAVSEPQWPEPSAR